jgi:type I restriction enzyme S subunit
VRRIRLRHIADVNPSTPEFDGLADDASVTFLPLECVWPGGSLDTSRIRTKAEVASGYTRFREGDLLVPKITPTFQADRSTIARGLVGGVGAGTTELHVVRPSPEVDARYILYSLKSRSFLLGGEAAMFGVAGQQRVPDDFLRDWLITIPGLVEQHAIADYLDAETARIDGIIAARRQQVRLVDEHQFALLTESLVPVGTPFVRLRHLAGLQAGLTVDALRDPGPDAVARPYLRVANVQPGRLDLDTVTEISVPRALADRCTLRVGDVLMTEGGDLDKLGRGTIWRGELPGALHQNHVFAVRPYPDVLSPDYLALLTQTAHARAYFERTGTRTTNLASTNSEKIMSLPVPRLTLEEQRAKVASTIARLAEIDRLRTRIQAQIDLLFERRQALITAAVTGQIEIPGVAA